jgi:hypothetical protein
MPKIKVYPKNKSNTENPNERDPNFRDDEGKLFLVRCFVCDKKHGEENYAMAVSSGICAWCGWKDE